MFLEVLALSPARQARGPTQPPSLRVLHTPNLSPPLRIPRLRLTGENELHHSAGHEAICLLLWNPGEIKSGQSTVIYLMYFWAGEPWPLGITFSRSGLRVYREEEQVTGCRATSSKSHPRQAGGGGRGGALHLLGPVPVPCPTSHVLPPNLGSRKLAGSFLPHLTLEATERTLLLREGTGCQVMCSDLSSREMGNLPDSKFGALDTSTRHLCFWLLESCSGLHSEPLSEALS